MILDRLTCLQREVLLKASIHLDERVGRPAAATLHKFLADRSSNTFYIYLAGGARVSSRLLTRMVKIAQRSPIIGDLSMANCYFGAAELGSPPEALGAIQG